MKYPNGSESILSRGPWSQLVAIRGAVCSDGKARVARVGNPDTHFSAPASVKVRGRTVTGFVTCDNDGYRFTANTFGKNAALLPREVVNG
jgi:hypothetical protein